jgi:hypothetical protein
VAAITAARGGLQPRGQQSLAAAQIQYARSPAQQTELENGAEHRIAAKLAARKVIRESSRLAILLACRIDQRGDRIGYRLQNIEFASRNLRALRRAVRILILTANRASMPWNLAIDADRVLRVESAIRSDVSQRTDIA